MRIGIVGRVLTGGGPVVLKIVTISIGVLQIHKIQFVRGRVVGGIEESAVTGILAPAVLDDPGTVCGRRI